MSAVGVTGSKDFIKRAFRARKVLGGAMRQNGVVAAMGLYGIDKVRCTCRICWIQILVTGSLCGPSLEYCSRRIYTRTLALGLCACVSLSLFSHCPPRELCTRRYAFAEMKSSTHLRFTNVRSHMHVQFSGDNLRKDHANMKRLAEGLATLPGVAHVDLAAVESNILYFDVAEPHDGASVKAALKERDIIISGAKGSRNIRIVTHHQVGADDIDRVLAAFKEVLVKA